MLVGSAGSPCALAQLEPGQLIVGQRHRDRTGWPGTRLIRSRRSRSTILRVDSGWRDLEEPLEIGFGGWFYPNLRAAPARHAWGNLVTRGQAAEVLAARSSAALPRSSTSHDEPR